MGERQFHSWHTFLDSLLRLHEGLSEINCLTVSPTFVTPVKKQLDIDDTCVMYKGEIVGGDYPVIGTMRRRAGLAITKENLIITSIQTDANAVNISLPHVRANVADESAISVCSYISCLLPSK